MRDGKLVGRFGMQLLLAAVVLTAAGPAVFGQRPAPPDLLPESTVGYVRIGDVRELVRQFGETAVGRVIRDPQVQPFVQQLAGASAEALGPMAEQFGLTLEQLQAIPQGEACLALVAPEEGKPALVALLDVGDQLPAARQLLEGAQARMEDRGDVRTTETWRGTELTILEHPGEPPRQRVFFERDRTIVLVSNLELAEQVLSVWGGVEAPTLADNPEFAAIMERCSGAAAEPPQLTYFADPLRLVKSAAAENLALQMGIAMLEPLGLDGLLGFGGSLTLADEQFESIHHVHLLLDRSRPGVLDVLSPRPGDATPELWVPNDVAKYMSLHWDLPKSYGALASAYDTFRGEGAWAKKVLGPLNEELGVNFERDVLPALEGRLLRVTWMQEPERINGQATLLGLKLKDAEAFRPTLERIARGDPSRFQQRVFAGVVCYQFSPRRESGGSDDKPSRLPKSHAAIVGDYLLLSDGPKLLEQAIATKRGSSPSLRDALDYKLIASKISRLAGARQPAMLSFERPEVRFRSTYELLRSEETRQRLAEISEKNKLLQTLRSAIEDHPLPPFDALEKYFALSGGMLTSDASGIHGVRFTFRRD